MKRLLVSLGVMAMAAGCSPDKGDEGGNNPIDDVMEPKFAAEGIVPVEASNEEVCHRLSADLLGHFLSAAEVKSECKGRSVNEIVKRFQARPEYLVVSERNWRDRFRSSDVLVEWRELQDLYNLVDDLHLGKIRYEDFALQAMSHPGFVMNVFQPEEKVQYVFSAFLGREATETEAADLGGLYRPWLPSAGMDPDFPYIYSNPTVILPVLCELTPCNATMYGGGQLDLSSFVEPVQYQGVLYRELNEAQKDILREPGRILTSQAFFYEAAADEILNRLLAWSDGGRFPREPGIVLPQVREVLSDYIRETGNIPAAERLVMSSWLYRMKAAVPDDGLGDDPTAPVPAIYAAGPVKPAAAEVWLDSIAPLTLNLGACDARYADGFPYFLISQAMDDGLVTSAQGYADIRRLWEMQESRMPWDDEQGFPDFTYTFVARLIGGCPGYLSARQEQTGLSYAFTQESLAELVCDPTLAANLTPAGSDQSLEAVVKHQMNRTYGRDPSTADLADFSAAAATCVGVECSPEGIKNSVCVGLAGGAEMIFY